jgi:hypothetical protein
MNAKRKLEKYQKRAEKTALRCVLGQYTSGSDVEIVPKKKRRGYS